MKTSIRRPETTGNGETKLTPVQLEYIQIPDNAVMSIDGSTTNTGVGILRERDGALYYSCAFTREKNETPVQYKVRLKREIHDILIRNPLIRKVYYEEPFIGYATAAPNLFMLRTFIEELVVENEPQFNYLAYSEINNKKWKRLFLAPDKCPTGTEAEKAAVRTKLETYLPFMADGSQDEIDAICMGLVACTALADGTNSDLASKKKPHAFQYNITFIGADSDDEMCSCFGDIYNGPKILLENGVSISDIKSTSDFDKHVYTQMGTDDKILVIKFPSSKHADLTLKYRQGNLAASFDYLYAIVWRKGRK